MTLEDALDSIHRVLTRTLAYLETDPKTLGRILDDAEFLVALFRQGEIEDDFRRHLADIERKFTGFEGLVSAYDARCTSSRQVA